MRLPEIRTGMVPLEHRWTVADEQFAAFVERPMSNARRRQLDREKSSGGRTADRQLAAERAYDEETDQFRRGIHVLADHDRRAA